MTQTELFPNIGAFIVGFGKAGFASGISLLQTPLIAYAMPARAAIGIVLPLLIAADFMTVGVFWKKWNFNLIRWPIIGCVFGIAIGMFFINIMSDKLLRHSIGGLALFLTALLLIRDTWYPTKTYKPAWWHGFLVGVAAGFSSTLAHAAGPIIALFLIAQKLDKVVFVASSSLFFFVTNLMKLPPYVYSGLINKDVLKVDLHLLPMIPLGIGVGWLMNRWLPQKYFVYVVYVLLIVAGVDLVRK